METVDALITLPLEEDYMKLVIPDEDPDLDGAASAYAYGEFLKQQDEEATGAVFGDLSDETKELLEEIDERISDASYYLYSADEIVLVSTSAASSISSRISEDKVVEIIDHEAIGEDFPEAEITVDEEFNTTAAIIAEKFKDTDTEITEGAASLLKEAIKRSDANEKDQEILEWLENR